MIFALGFIAATLIALLIIPAINARANRLARRRAEALFPMSVAELTVEKDHLRAEFAVERRRIERKAEAALAARRKDMEEIGRQALRIVSLEETLAERGETLKLLESSLTQTQDRLNAAEGDLDETRRALSGTREALAALEKAHGTTLDVLSDARMTIDLDQREKAEIRMALAEAEEKLARLSAENAGLSERLTAALSDLDAKRILISSLETRLTTQKAKAEDFERGIRDRDEELARERQRLAELADALMKERGRGAEFERRLREAEEIATEGPGHLQDIEKSNEALREEIIALATRIVTEDNPQAARQRRSANQ